MTYRDSVTKSESKSRKDIKAVENRLGSLEIFSIATAIDSLYIKLEPKDSVIAAYAKMAKNMPHFIPSELQEKVLDYCKSDDTSKVNAGAKVLVFFNMKTILSVAEPFFEFNKGHEDEIVHAGVQSVLEMPKGEIDPHSQISVLIHRAALKGIAWYVAAKENIPIALAMDQPYVMNSLNDLIFKGFTDDSLRRLVENLHDKRGVKRKHIYHYLIGKADEEYNHLCIFRLLRRKSSGKVNIESGMEICKEDSSKKLYEVLKTLPPKLEKVIELRFGLDDGEEKTGKEVGKIFNVTESKIFQLEHKAFVRLRHPSKKRVLRDLLDD